jgi:uncharacterized phage infection (PIP) family protein YhgE
MSKKLRRRHRSLQTRAFLDSIKNFGKKVSQGVSNIKAGIQERKTDDYIANKAAKEYRDTLYNLKVKKINEKYDHQIKKLEQISNETTKELENTRKQFLSKTNELDSKTKTMKELTSKSESLAKEIQILSDKQGNLATVSLQDQTNLADVKDKKKEALEKANIEADQMVQKELSGKSNPPPRPVNPNPSARLRRKRRFSRV